MHFLERHDPSLYARYRQSCNRDARLVEIFEDLETIARALEQGDGHEADLERLVSDLTTELRRRLSEATGARPRPTETREHDA